MKHATLNKQAMPAASRPSGIERRNAGVHHPKRRTVASAALASPAEPHITFTLMDTTVTLAAPQSEGICLTVPHVLLIDSDGDTALALRSLLVPEAKVVHAATCAEARRLLETHLFSLVIVDPSLPDGNAINLLGSIASTPLLVYSAREPRATDKVRYLPKPFTTPRQLWTTISGLLGIPGNLTAGD
jgi:CheY-like chemotaxis protein